MELNKTYILRVMIGEKLLTYIGTIISVDNFFVSFIDKFGKKISLSKTQIQSYEEAEHGN